MAHHSTIHTRKNHCISKLVRHLKRFAQRGGRAHLPWRKARDPYAILVSEVMLQQTQVGRVIPFYAAFLAKFPDLKALAGAPLEEVLATWQGLGYNRRARALRDAARAAFGRWGGELPQSASELESLPGVGPYTARAVAAFAFERPEIFIETNIRTVFLHYCFTGRRTVRDAELLPLVAEALARSRMRPSIFYAALMDHGAELKHSGLRLNAQSAHYARQPRFEGSRRQLRGKILRALLEAPLPLSALARVCGEKAAAVRAELLRLEKEKLVRRTGAHYALAD